MKSSIFGVRSILGGALTLGALVLGGCGGGGGSSNGSNSGGGSTGGSTGGSSLLNTIVFVSNRDGNNEIYSMKSDGTAQTRLTNSAGADNSPSRSRNGNRIVFSSNRDGNFEIYTMGIAGETSNLLRLTTDGVAPPDDTNPVYSADGSKIAWISTRGGSANVWTMDSTGANQTQLTTEGNVSSVAFAPNGTEVAFAVTRAGASVIVAKNLATQAERVLVSGAFDALAPSYNPTGTSLVFTQRTTGSSAQGLRILPLAGGAIVEGPGVGNTGASFDVTGAFSPDGTRLVLEIPGTTSPQIGLSTGLSGVGVTSLTSLGSNFSPSLGQ